MNITSATDEDDLLGGFRLINGDTVWQDGPVVSAMKRGAVLLLDEIDLASHQIMCLQPVLEGKGVFLKKIGTFVKPEAGFTVFATANTKGKGDESGKFTATNILNEAFLDRFPVTLEQEYAPKTTEKKIVMKVMKSLNAEDKDFAKNLVEWSDMIRKCYAEDAVDEIITTRRLENVCKAFAIFVLPRDCDRHGTEPLRRRYEDRLPRLLRETRRYHRHHCRYCYPRSLDGYVSLDFLLAEGRSQGTWRSMGRELTQVARHCRDRESRSRLLEPVQPRRCRNLTLLILQPPVL